MSALNFVRLAAVLIAVSYFIDSLPDEGWLENRLCHNSPIYEGYHSPLQTFRQWSICLIAVLALVLALFAVPRASWGLSALSWCFIAMGICALTILQTGLDARLLCVYLQVSEYASLLRYALPPLILGGLLRYRFVREHVLPSKAPDGKNV